jgi:esterase/lipase superfamily enzyme
MSKSRARAHDDAKADRHGANAGALVEALFDPVAEVRVAAFGALSRLPLAATDWFEVERYAQWSLRSGASPYERLVVIDSARYLPLPLVRERITQLAELGDADVKSRAIAAIAEFPEPEALVTKIRNADSDSLGSAQRLASRDISPVAQTVEELCRTVPPDDDLRFWLALALARSGKDRELRSIFAEVEKGAVYPFATPFLAAGDGAFASPGGIESPHDTLRRVLVGSPLPEPVRSWLSATVERLPHARTRALADALLTAARGSFLDPPLADGSPGFVAYSAPMMRRARAELAKLNLPLESMPVEGLQDKTDQTSLDPRIMAPVLEHDLVSAAVTLLFRRAITGGDWDHWGKLPTLIVGWLQRNQGQFQPDLAGLFTLYRREAAIDCASYFWSREGVSDWFYHSQARESWPRWHCYQIAWTVSRGGLRGLVPALAARLTSKYPMERMAAAFLVADAADYITRSRAPLFGGGYGPDHSIPKQPAAQELARAVEQEEETQQSARLYRVWFATNRAVKSADDPSKGFGNKPDSAGVVRYGTCTVQIPEAHTHGSVGTAWHRRWLKLRFSDDHLKIVDRVPIEPLEFFRALRAELAALSHAERVALVYLHGYNVSFDDAAIRAAQIGFDLKVLGLTAFFSWPSCGSILSYFADTNRIAASERHIADFLIRVATDSGASAVHLIAHSMGSLGLARAIPRITAQASSAGGVRFGQIVLAAPDMEVELFRDLAAIYPSISERTTMYVSKKDRALRLAKRLQRHNRAGFSPPVTVVPRIDTVEVSKIDVTLLGHRYYAEAESLLTDMIALLQHNDPPSRRPRLREAGRAGARYWIIK